MSKTLSIILLLVIQFLFCGNRVCGQQAQTGLASKYSSDHGIEKDSAVIFVEDFDEESLDEMQSRWEDVSYFENMSFSTDIPENSGGEQSLLITHSGGEGTGGHLYRRLLPGYNELYVRFYVKFDPDCYPIHHFTFLGGYNPSTSWPQGGAGIKPDGDERWVTAIEPMGESWAWDFYTYWMHMRTNPDTNFWGNTFSGRPSPYTVTRGEWISIECMVKMNDPVSSYNGEQAFWINGEKLVHLGEGFPNGNWVWDGFTPDPEGDPFEGFQWRNVEELNFNFLWILLYITDASSGYVSKVWFDDIVVATQYIGPMTPQTVSSWYLY